MQPLISIITVVYNGERYLEQTIASVLGQTYDNIEYLIIDGGSTDGTIDIIKKYEQHLSGWVSEKDQGLYDAMNKGIARAKGELIGMINSDDWFEATAVETVVKEYRAFPDKKIFHGDRNDILNNGKARLKRFHPSNIKFKYLGMTYNHPSMFVHRELYARGTYNIHLQALSDYEFVLAHYLRNPELFRYIPVAYVNYRLDGISANMKLFRRIKEGYRARKNAGLNILENSFSALFRMTVFSAQGLMRRKESKHEE
ncbi:glycosyltransferase family 2 protein [Salinimicrobium sp. TH3]|uniref:glycosyltransferase family 2 protein n=1 Tax=Salinimicrobium sp. TH3 TaxID=2997342 RepID=UPI00227239D7|nr:glycosyltransferase family 2 protein [Salinimicrobium sp. TH3]MCY2687774.1 glycosyltransferase family 2 protein [Salinimicrobium sp. TH3]